MFRSGSGDLSRQLAYLLHDEPVVRYAVSLLQQQCLSGGLRVRFGAAEETSATSWFERHVDQHYTQFCRQAIEAFMAVGFAPYRVVGDVPEVLPLGTYGWRVERTVTPSLLRYEVSTTYCEDALHVHAFIPPPALFICDSPLASLLPVYRALCHKRECVQRADEFNSQPGVVFEQQDHTRVNEYVKQGVTITEQIGNDRRTGERINTGERQRNQYELMDEFRTLSRLPDETVTVVAPTGQSVHSLDRVVTPQLILREELAFARAVALAFGLPAGLLLQGIVDDKEDFKNSLNLPRETRGLLDTCRHLNTHLEALLGEVYRVRYASTITQAPRFRIAPIRPTLALEPLTALFHARLVDDAHLSELLMATWGVPLGAGACAARDEQRRAEFSAAHDIKPKKK